MKISLVNKEAKWPTLYPTVERKDPTVADKGWDKVGDFTLRDKVDFMPQRGLQEKLCSCESNLVFLAGAASMGKGMALDAPILTPDGFKALGDLREKDVITGSDGGKQYIEKVFDMGIKKMYRFIMKDGSTVETSEDHLWPVELSFYKTRGVTTFLTTSEIVSLFNTRERKCGSLKNIKFPLNGPIQFNRKAELPINPYILGLLLGDGGFTQTAVKFSSADEETITAFLNNGYSVKHLKNYDYLISGNNLTASLKELGIMGHNVYTKFIPNQYLYASIEERCELLRGLMDTDGSCDAQGGIVEYSTSSEQLSIDFAFLVRSLGYKCVVKTRIPHYTYNGKLMEGAKSYRIRLSSRNLTDVFGLSRKRERVRPYKQGISYDELHYLNKIEFTGEKECRCIKVSNEDRLFITNDFIVTHNTYCMLLNALRGIDKSGYTARFISVRLQDSKKGSSIFRDGVEILGNFAGCQYNSSDYPTFTWPQWNSNLQMIHSNFNVENPAEWEDFKDYAKKNQASYIAIDEATEIRSFKMFSYWFSRNRDSSGMKPQMVLSFNPEYEHWTTRMLMDAGYLGSDFYIKPEMNGATRYFYMAGDGPEEIIWGNTPEEVAEAAHIEISEKEREAGVTIYQIIKSFTFFTGEAGDNKKLIAATGGESIGNLHAVGATQRSILHGAYFGPHDNEETTVSRQMIQNMFSAPSDDDDTMYGTLDVSMGNKDSDNCPFFVWRGHTVIAIVFIRTDPKTLVDEINKVLTAYGIPVENFAFDATGVGYYLTAFTKGMGITGNRRTIQEYDEAGNPVMMEQYFNLRSQLMGKMKVLLEKGEISCSVDPNTSIPYGKEGRRRQLIDVFYDEINVFRTTTRLKKIYYRSKDEYKAKFHSSPDIMDSFNLRAIFDLDGREKKKPTVQVEDDAYFGIYNSYARSARAWS